MTDDKITGDGRAVQRARVLLVLTAAMWSTSGLFAKAPWLQSWPLEVRGTLLAFWRTLFAGLFLLPLVRRPTWTWRLIPATVIFALMNVTYLNAMTQTTAANAIWLQNTAPLWVVLYGALMHRTHIARAAWGMLGFGALGIGLILTCELTSTEVAPMGILWGVLGGITFAAVVITVHGLRDLDAAWVIVMNHLVTAAILLPFVVRTGIYPTRWETLFLIAFGVLQLGLPYVLFARCLQHVPSHEASFLVLLEPLLVPIWVFLAYHGHPSYEPPRWWTWVGAGLILAGLVTRYARGTTARKAGPHSS